MATFEPTTRKGKKRTDYRDLSGLQFGRWTVVRLHEFKPPRRFWWCRCECGNERAVVSGTLTQGRSLSCGCLRSERTSQACRVHGYHTTNSQTYRVWRGIHDRCENPHSEAYRNYGGRGIAVCERWRDFLCFLADMGEAPRGLTSERIDNNGNYEPSNCRWATQKDQCNNKRDNRYVTVDEETRTLSQWAERVGVSPKTITGRLNRGWSPKDAVTRRAGEGRRGERR